MKSCFASENQEANVISKAGGSNRETTYVQSVSGNQVQDPRKPLKGTAETEGDKNFLISNNGSQPILLVSRPGDQQTADTSGSKDGKLQSGEAGMTQPSDSSNEETLLYPPQPEWYTDLDGISRGKVRELCELAGPPPVDANRVAKLRELFKIDLGQAFEVNELYHSGRLQTESRVMLKSILKTSTSSLRSLDEKGGAPNISRRLSWIDESGGNLEQKHEMKTWHYMDSPRRSSPTQCCQIL